MSESIKIIYADFRINIKSINNKWWLDFYHNNKRVRKSTLLIANDENLKHIKTIVITKILYKIINDIMTV